MFSDVPNVWPVFVKPPMATVSEERNPAASPEPYVMSNGAPELEYVEEVLVSKLVVLLQACEIHADPVTHLESVSCLTNFARDITDRSDEPVSMMTRKLCAGVL